MDELCAAALLLWVSVDFFIGPKLDTILCGLEACEVTLVFILFSEGILDYCTDFLERVGRGLYLNKTLKEFSLLKTDTFLDWFIKNK